MKIENWKLRATRGGEPFSGALNRASASKTCRLLLTPIFNFQFSILNLAIVFLFCVFAASAASSVTTCRASIWNTSAKPSGCCATRATST